MNRTIFTLDALPIAHFETYIPLFLKHMLNLAIPLKFWVPAQSEVGWSRTVAAKIGVFGPLFWRKSFFWSISTQWTPPSVIHGWKAMDLSVLTVLPPPSRVEPVGRQIFGNASGMVSSQDLTWRHIQTFCWPKLSTMMHDHDLRYYCWLICHARDC